MNAYLIGNLFGRLVASYAIVWLIMLVVSKADWRAGFRRTHCWYGLLSVLLVFVVGLADAVVKHST